MDKQLQNALSTINQKVSEYDRLIESLPRTTEDVEALFLELAESDRDAKAHFVKFPRPDGPHETYMGRKDVEEDWIRVCARRDRAVRALSVFAASKYPAAEVAA